MPERFKQREKVPKKKSPDVLKPRRKGRVVLKLTLRQWQRSVQKRKEATLRKRKRQERFAPAPRQQVQDIKKLSRKFDKVRRLTPRTETSRRLTALQVRIVARELESGKRGIAPDQSPNARTVLGYRLSQKLVLGALIQAEGFGAFQDPSNPRRFFSYQSSGSVMPAAVIPLNREKSRLGVIFDPNTNRTVLRGDISYGTGLLSFQLSPSDKALSVDGNIKLKHGRLMGGINLNPINLGSTIGYQVHGVGLMGSVGYDPQGRSLSYSVSISFDLGEIIRRAGKK